MHDLFDAASDLVSSRGTDLLDLLETLQSRIEDLVPDGCRIAACGTCGRRSVVPKGERLRSVRLELQLSQTDVARAAGVPRQVINAVETEKRDPTTQVLEAYDRLARRAEVSS